MNTKQVYKALEQIAKEQHQRELRKKRIEKAAFMEHIKTCLHCAEHFKMAMQQRAMEEAGVTAGDLLSRIASHSLTPPTMH